MMAMILLALAAYLSCGFLFAVLFVLIGVKRIDPHAAHSSWGFRILIFPGTIFLWPLLARRWFSGASEPPEEYNAHRIASRSAGLGPAATPNAVARRFGETTMEFADSLRLTEPRSEI